MLRPLNPRETFYRVRLLRLSSRLLVRPIRAETLLSRRFLAAVGPAIARHPPQDHLHVTDVTKWVISQGTVKMRTFVQLPLYTSSARGHQIVGRQPGRNKLAF